MSPDSPGGDGGDDHAASGEADASAAPDMIDPAWHLPGHGPESLPESVEEETERWHTGRTPSGAEFRTPRLDSERAEAIAARVRATALRARRERTPAQVIEAVARAAGRLGAPEGETSAAATALLRRELGWSEELARETLSEMARGWTEAALRGLVEGELGEIGVLERFRGEGSRKRRAAGPPLLFVVNAGNVPGVAITAVIRGLLVRSGVLCKAPEEEPGLLALFARSLAREDELLGRCVATTWWAGGRPDPAADAWAQRAGRIVVYGGAEAVRGVRASAPAETDILAYGPRIGLGVVLADAARSPGEAPARLARDLAAYDQRGCVSPRLLYVIGREPDAFAEALAAALEAEHDRLPRPDPGAREAIAIRALRAEAELGTGWKEAASASDADAVVEHGAPAARRVITAGDRLAWTLLVGGDPAPISEGLPGVLRIHSFGDLSDLAATLRPLEGRIQAVGYAGTEEREALAELAAELGVSRVAPFGTLAWPPADWRHDGRFQLLPLLRWTEWEE